MNTQPEACKHEHIQTWRFEDSQETAMWSCVACAAKFEPIKGWMDQIERKDALLRACLKHVASNISMTFAGTEAEALYDTITSELAK